jgi:spoIIIJ-associated protein
MYERMTEMQEFLADSREAAIERAAEFFRADVGELTIREFEPSSVYGLAGRVLIVAGLKSAVGAPRPASARGSGSADAPRARGGREERGERGRRGERGGRGGRGERRGRDRESAGRGARSEFRAERPVREEANAPEDAPGPSVGEVVGELGEIGRFVHGLLERMGVGNFAISESNQDNLQIIEVRGPVGDGITRRDGRAMEAVQLLAQQVALRLAGEGEPARVVVDFEAEGEDREVFLQRVAERVAKRAIETGRAVALDPMNPRDRRLIHVALRDDSRVVTVSRGEGRYRQVVVIPEAAPEFEDARASARAQARE